MTVTNYHNPSCLMPRNVLAMIRQSGEEPIVIEYLKESAESRAAQRANQSNGHSGPCAIARV
jgi:arsenate reductase-like glutaredoxin family protein